MPGRAFCKGNEVGSIPALIEIDSGFKLLFARQDAPSVKLSAAGAATQITTPQVQTMFQTNGHAAALLSPRVLSIIRYVLLTLGLAAVSAAHAETIVVNDPTDGALTSGMCLPNNSASICTLRAAIQKANSQGGFDTITLPAGTYNLTIPGRDEKNSATGDLNISESLTISGENQANTIINANNLDRVFHIFGGATVTLRNMTIKGGLAQSDVGGGIYLASGTLTIENCTISDNKANNPARIVDRGNGGGIYSTTSGILTIVNTTISRNISDSNNLGIGGGGIFNAGALHIQDNSVIDSNSAINSPSAGGGGIQNQGAQGQDPNVARVTIIRTIISGNSAVVGGGVRNLYGSVYMQGVTLSGNNASTSGGGIENGGGGTIITNTTVRNNTAGRTGGGISNSASMNIEQSAIYGNSATGISDTFSQGGGIYNAGQNAMNIINTTVSQNNAYEGGGIYNHRAISITNSTIYNNASSKANSATEIVACGTKDEAQNLDCSNQSNVVETEIINTIVGNASGAPACLVVDVVPAPTPARRTITSKGYNIDTGTSCGFTGTGDKSNIPASNVFVDSSNAGLALNNDEPTTLNYAIFPGSIAQNAGTNIECPAIDQRYYRRDSACDIGAYEISGEKADRESLADLKLEVTSNAITQGGGGQVTFTVTVTNKGPNAANNVILLGKLPPWGMPEANSITTNNGGSCSLTATGFTCNLGTINAYTSAQVYVVVFPKESGTLVLEAEVSADQTDSYRPDNTTEASVAATASSGENRDGRPVVGNFSGKGGSLDWSWALLLLVPAARRFARRYH